jgi:subtilisin family serine protease
MAGPHVAGAAAILAQRHPEWTGAQLKAALIGRAAPAPDATLYQQGAGLIDLERALKQQVVAAQGDVWTAFPWNATGERVTTRTITYANASDTPITLDLSAQSEVLKLRADQVTVPANGESSITLTIDTGGKAPGDYPGTVTARSGETVIRTLAGAYVEPESYDVTITVLGRQGRPVTPRIGQIYDAKTGTVHSPAFRDGVARTAARGRLESLQRHHGEDRRKIPQDDRCFSADDRRRRPAAHGGCAAGQGGQGHA